MNDELKTLIEEQVKIKVSELSHWENIRWEGGRLYYESQTILNEISIFNIETKLLYFETLLSKQFIIQDNCPGQAPDITFKFKNWIKKQISQLKIMLIKEKNEWDRFEDRLTDRYNSEGIAELGRTYIKNGNAIDRHWKRDADDTDFIQVPIVAKGITAFLSDDNICSFRHSLSNGGRNDMVSANVWFDKDVYKNPNGGKDVPFFFTPYYECCISRLRVQDNARTPFPKERKSQNQLTHLHLKSEKQFYNESEKFYKELRSESERAIIETIRKAAVYYQDWVKDTHLKEVSPNGSDEYSNTLTNISTDSQFNRSQIGETTSPKIAQKKKGRSSITPVFTDLLNRDKILGNKPEIIEVNLKKLIIICKESFNPLKSDLEHAMIIDSLVVFDLLKIETIGLKSFCRSLSIFMNKEFKESYYESIRKVYNASGIKNREFRGDNYLKTSLKEKLIAEGILNIE